MFSRIAAVKYYRSPRSYTTYIVMILKLYSNFSSSSCDTYPIMLRLSKYM